MSQFVARQSSILHSRAELLILPLPSDGLVYGVLARLLGLYPSVYQNYRELAQKGKLTLGDVLLCPVQKEVVGLGVGSGKLASHVAIIIIHHQLSDPVRLSTLKTTYQTLRLQIFELMRTKSLKLVAMHHKFGIFGNEATNDEGLAEQVGQLLVEYLSVPRVKFEVYQ